MIVIFSFLRLCFVVFNSSARAHTLGRNRCVALSPSLALRVVVRADMGLFGLEPAPRGGSWALLWLGGGLFSFPPRFRPVSPVWGTWGGFPLPLVADPSEYFHASLKVLSSASVGLSLFASAVGGSLPPTLSVASVRFACSCDSVSVVKERHPSPKT